jgi:ATP-dependent DNA helicase DinG
VEAAPIAADALWPGRTVVATSATLRGTLNDGTPSFDPWLASVGAPADTRTLAVASPFDPQTQALLYVPKGRLPSPRQDGWRAAVADELWTLTVAAGGRTLALFTSRSATEEAAEALRVFAERDGSDLEVLTQWDGSRDELVAALRERRHVVLCATRSYWTGVDLPGDACVLVAVDRIPFPRPDDPVIQARRRLATARKTNDFSAVDLPDAAAQLAQGAGRLLRSPTDRGVVAVLDTRLATSSWRGRILGALPPFKRTIDHDEVAEFLRGC